MIRIDSKIRITSSILGALCLILLSCGDGSNSIEKETKTILSASELYSLNVDATCTILTNNAQGSGFFVSKDIVVTNYHVIEGASNAKIVLNNEPDNYDVVGYLAVDKLNDLILLKVDYKNSKTIDIEDETPSPGDKVYSIGTPVGMSKTISDGIVSSKRNFEGRTLLQITVPISHGSSGGPVLNEYGDLVGVAVGSIEEGNNINFCIPSMYVKNLLAFKESFATSLSSLNGDGKQVKSSTKNESTANATPGDENSQQNSSNASTSSTKRFKNPYTSASNTAKQKIHDWFYNNKEYKFLHKDKIDYSTVKVFEFEHPFKRKKMSGEFENYCIAYVLAYKYIDSDGKNRYCEFAFDNNYKKVASWTGMFSWMSGSTSKMKENKRCY